MANHTSNDKSQKMVFVFGSNLAGVHGIGAARTALLFHGAVYGHAIGRMGNSYAIPTKDRMLRPLPLDVVEQRVQTFLDYAGRQCGEKFKVTRIGCGFAGYKDRQIAPMFRAAPGNCYFDTAWRQWLVGKNFWGTYH